MMCRSACKYMQPERYINYSLIIILVERIYAGQSLLNLLEKFYYDANHLYITHILLQVALSTDRKMISIRVRSTFLLIFLSISLSIFNAGSLIFHSSECNYVSVEIFVLYRSRWFGFQNIVFYFSYYLCRIR